MENPEEYEVRWAPDYPPEGRYLLVYTVDEKVIATFDWYPTVDELYQLANDHSEGINV